ncbi:MAG: hypothetical protein RBR38_13375 [Desulfomicrobium apsheronum]|nr:hypothetical protein [Desulfomicrobium apsheronum]
MKNMNTLLHFMRYFEPHCVEKGGERICYVSALEYPDKNEVLEVFGGNGFFANGPTVVVLKYAGRKNVDGDDQWWLSDEQLPETFPVWEAR